MFSVLIWIDCCIFAKKIVNYMKYEFNTNRFAELMTNRGLSPKDVATLLGMTNKGTIREWRDGALIGTKRLIDICNAFDINPTEFFLCDEKILLS